MARLPVKQSITRTCTSFRVTPVTYPTRAVAFACQGTFTATYKYAVLLTLMDQSMEHVSRTGQPPESVTTRQLAEKVVELYWQHTARFPITETVLRQNQGTRDSWATGKTVSFTRSRGPATGCSPIRRSSTKR